MPQGYTPSSTTTGTPEQLRQALGYVPARTAVGGTGSGITVIGGPSGPEISFDTSVLLAAGAFSVSEEPEDFSGMVIPGPAGQAGAVGPQGPAGSPGVFGLDGIDGQDSFPIPGPVGATGPTGVTGPQGSVGPPGSDGEEGPEGFGIPGPPGPTGPPGSTGSAGATGPQGLAGFPGFDGEEGPEGFGLPGPAGVNGATGATGATGPSGPVGLGVPGMDGEEGPEGFAIPGPMGPSGTNGTGVLVYQDGTVPGGNTIANTTADTAFASSYTIPANSLAVGNVIKVKLFGVYSTALVAPTLTLKFKVGATTVLASSAINTLVGSSTNLGWTAEATFIVTALGASGTFECQGLSEFSTNSIAAAGLLENLTNTAVIGSIATTGMLTVAASGTWGTASASNSITLRQMVVEVETVGSITPSTGAEVLLATVVPSGVNSATLMTGIPGTFAHLKIIGVSRTTAAVTSTPIKITLNADGSTANYKNERVYAAGNAAAGNEGLSDGFIYAGDATGTNVTAGYPSSFELLLPYYSGTTFMKSAIGDSQLSNGTGTGAFFRFALGSVWLSTAAITQIDITLTSGNFVAGSTFKLYGVY